uniref:Uncharacterized protein n=1 Tax=Oryza nivara TaxID=4536 RepID=A0A0E0GTY9_ORYNI
MVSGSGVCAPRVVVDARHHMLSRLASIIAKELLNGKRVVVVRCEEICMSGGLVRQKMKYLRLPAICVLCIGGGCCDEDIMLPLLKALRTLAGRIEPIIKATTESVWIVRRPDATSPINTKISTGPCIAIHSVNKIVS